ncbi:MAG: hypothetical protein ACE5FV_14335 [Woeseia sp.]
MADWRILVTEALIETTPVGAPRAGPIGRILRFITAGFLFVTVAPHYLTASWQSNLKIAAAIAGLVILYTTMHLIIAKYVPRLNRWLGALLAVAPAAALFLIGGGIGQMGALSYVGGSLFIDSLNGDSGCEVMAVPGIVCNERTHLACILFSPLDWLEQKLFLEKKVFG